MLNAVGICVLWIWRDLSPLFGKMQEAAVLTSFSPFE
jgi:hypothetical protein